MKNAFKTTLSALALVAMTAVSASAATLFGTFTIDIRNFSDIPGDSTIVTQGNSAANAVNFGLQTSDAVIEYTGFIDFFNPPASGGNTTIADFLGSANGNISLISGDAAALNTRLSAGNYVTTTIFQITGKFLSDAVAGSTIRHDDGITLQANGRTGGISAPPTVAIVTPFTAKAGDFTLYYAAANGNPSVLKVNVVPLPAGGVLLLSAFAGIVALRRRKTA